MKDQIQIAKEVTLDSLDVLRSLKKQPSSDFTAEEIIDLFIKVCMDMKLFE